MGTYNQAPLLLAKGDKMRSKTYWSYDPNLISYIMNKCGKADGQLKLMLYLMGNCPEKWRCSTADVLDKTGISSKQSLSKIKKELKARNWIDFKEGEHITVLYDNIYQQMNDG